MLKEMLKQQKRKFTILKNGSAIDTKDTIKEAVEEIKKFQEADLKSHYSIKVG